VLVSALWLIVFCRGDEPEDRAASSAVSVRVSAQSPYRGSGSCSATACHGNITPLPPKISRVWRSEHTIWISDDAHSRAYQVLFDDRSERIARNLAGGGNVKRASEDVRCLACHTTPRTLPSMTATTWMNADGVGCESCHGPSAGWLGPHTTDSWTNWSPQTKADLGFQETKTLVRRAEICADCHVGRRSRDGLVDRDVNHDLIAAGHPRLNFEFSAYLANMPPHWSEKEPNPTPPGRNNAQVAADFPTRAWAIGRLVSAKAAVELLEARAASAESRTAPWPEFTEYGCFSCHHDLRDQAWRRGGRPAGRLVGSRPWGSWSLAGIDELVGEIATESDARPLVESLHRLSILMEKPVPDATAVGRASREAARAAGRCLESIAAKRFGAPEVTRLIERLDRRDAWDRAASWDDSGQRYLALVPLRLSWIELAPERRADQDRLATRLEGIRDLLAFPPGFDSPRSFDPTLLRNRPGH
jgi:hypothetical protein